MDGNLQEISINNILQLIEWQQISGVLFVETSSFTTNENKIFIVFCCFGKITYLADNHSFTLVRIHDFLRYYQLENSLIELSSELISSSNIPEYEAILLLGQKQILSNYQSKKILQSIVQEILFDLLGLSKGYFSWQKNYKLQPQMIQLPISPLLKQINWQQQLWMQYYPHIQLSSQCPIIQDQTKLKATLTAKTYTSLANWLDGNNSLIQLSRYLHQDLVLMTKAIYPAIKMGFLKLLNNPEPINYSPSIINKSKNIIYLTKDINLSSILNILLKNNHYQLLVINDLGAAFEAILDHNPCLIFLEMESFNLSSEQFCKMLRSYQKLLDTPIIAIINHYQFVDNLKHKIAGITEYITKSTVTKDLFNIIDKYL